jgi:glycosyltransferase involved in cell wall biosynthesis
MRHLSPAVIVAAKKRRLPVVVRLSDYELVCPEAHLLRQGRVCEECVSSGSFWPSVRHACVNNSRLQSVVNALAREYHNSSGYLDQIDCLVTPSRIVLEKMIEGGFDRERLTTIPTFVDTVRFRPGSLQASQRKTIAYVGQLRPEKGIDVLLSAWSLVRDLAQEQGVKLVIAGSGPSDYEEQLRRSTVGDSTVEFLGTLKAEAIAWLYQQARLTVIPSVWYENLPNSLLESYACGTPVLASAIGSLAEYVTPGETGWTFTAGSSSDLAAGLRTALLDHDRIDGLSRGARRRAVAEHCAELHLNRLLTIFSELCAGNELREEEPALWI